MIKFESGLSYREEAQRSKELLLNKYEREWLWGVNELSVELNNWMSASV